MTKVERIGGERSGAGGQPLPFSPATRAGESQTRRTMENLIRVLESAGCTLENVAKANVWLDDPRDFWTFNRVYAGFFPKGGPARSTVRSQLMVDAKVEIDAIAYAPR